MVKAGSITSMAKTRGTTRYWTGLIAITSSASISSDTFIVPSSAATAEPLRPITITAIKTGSHLAQECHHHKIGNVHFAPEALERISGLHGHLPANANARQRNHRRTAH